MSKIRESGYVNDFVMFRNACEERKLKYTLSQIEKMKKSYNKEQDKARLFFAVQYLAVPTRRKQSNTERPRSTSKIASGSNQKKLLQKRKSFSTVTVPVFQTDTENGMEHEEAVEQPEYIETLPEVNMNTETTEVEEIMETQEGTKTEHYKDVEKTLPQPISVRDCYGEKSDNISTILKIGKKVKQQTKLRSPGLSTLQSKEEWERKLEAMKPAEKSISRREEVELARLARDHWRESFDQMKLQRLSLYQSRILSNTGDKEKTFVKFLPKNEQAFYLKDVQFAQKFL